MNIIEIIEKIEGEAKLNFTFNENKKIDFVNIEFLSQRGIETILENRNAFDALVINPRVCGICGHAHLIATVKAIEDCYKNIQISQKAKILRELTLNFELIQNHFKWFYLVLLPLFGYKQYVLKATEPSILINKAIAILAGQYPHNSYSIVGGVVSQPTEFDMLKIISLIDEVITFFEKNIIQYNLDDILEEKSITKFLKFKGDLAIILNKIIDNNWQNLGNGYNRFIVF